MNHPVSHALLVSWQPTLNPAPQPAPRAPTSTMAHVSHVLPSVKPAPPPHPAHSACYRPTCCTTACATRLAPSWLKLIVARVGRVMTGVWLVLIPRPIAQVVRVSTSSIRTVVWILVPRERSKPMLLGLTMLYANSVQVHVRLAQLYRPTVRHVHCLMHCTTTSVWTHAHQQPSTTPPPTSVSYANTHV